MAFNPKELGIPESNEEADAINAEFEMQTLRRLATEWNEHVNNDAKKIDLTRIKQNWNLLFRFGAA
jgi:plasmid maintenance system killer protein